MFKVGGPRRVRIHTPTTQLNKLSHALSFNKAAVSSSRRIARNRSINAKRGDTILFSKFAPQSTALDQQDHVLYIRS